jgi:tRNA pseudouridine38-40 synthase
VHALAQVASIRLKHDIEVHSLVRALNAKLPLDVRVLSVEQVEDQFHARFYSRRKEALHLRLEQVNALRYHV